MRKHSLKLAVLLAVVLGIGVDVASGAGPGAAVRVGSSFVVEPPMARYVAELDPRELTEQIRDWAVLATVTRLGATPEEAAAATYELPPARLPYLDELYAFEYGRGRRAYLGSRVLLFRDGADPDPQATLGRLADRVREETGAIPAAVEVYLVHDQRDDGTIRIERARDIAGLELFSAAYGYVEGKGDSVAELGAWLAKADDLSFAQLRDGKLVVGGRRFAKTRTANLTVQDVAALYQAHEQLGAPQLAARRGLRTLPPAAHQTARRIVELLQTDQVDDANRLLPELGRQLPPVSDAQADAIRNALVASAAPVRGPGFSLDPEVIPDPKAPARSLLRARTSAFIARPCDEIDRILRHASELERAEPDASRRTALARRALMFRELVGPAHSKHGREAICAAVKELMPEVARMSSAIERAAPRGVDTTLAEHHQLDAQLSAIRDVRRAFPAAVTALAFEYYRADSTTQCARYEGTAGTEVGMTMFYTDLLAKLWMSVDHGLSAPILDVAGFVSNPQQLRQAPQLAASIGQESSTRIWFGPRAGAVSRLDGDGTAMLFDHVFARIYAAGSDPKQPGVETLPNEVSRRAIGWWDRHYDEVADYEPEFHRLNQIMKWSLITGALLEDDVAQYLGLVVVRRDREFGSWFDSQRSRLRFVGSIPRPTAALAGRECLPIFESQPQRAGDISWSISGGVGAASRAAVPRVPVVNRALPLAARKPPPVDLGGSTAGNAVRATPRQAGKEVVFDRTAGVPMRDGKGNVNVGTPKVTYNAAAKPGGLEVRAGDPARPIGTIAAQPSGTTVKLTWRDGPVEQARLGAGTPARGVGEADRLAQSGDVVGAASAYQAAPAAVSKTPLDRARQAVLDAAQRRPKEVMRSLDDLMANRARLTPDAQKLIVSATESVSTRGAAGHARHALQRNLPLDNAHGRLAVERGKIIQKRDAEVLETTSASIPPATDLSARGVYVDARLLAGREGMLHDLGGQAGRWQQRPNVRMSELRQQPMGPPADRILETSTGTTFHYIPPTNVPAGRIPLPPIVIRHGHHPTCDADRRTTETSDDCAARPQ